jgi:hypothetical protein
MLGQMHNDPYLAKQKSITTHVTHFCCTLTHGIYSFTALWVSTQHHCMNGDAQLVIGEKTRITKGDATAARQKPKLQKHFVQQMTKWHLYFIPICICHFSTNASELIINCFVTHLLNYIWWLLASNPISFWGVDHTELRHIDNLFASASLFKTNNYCFVIHLLNHMVVVGFKSYPILWRWCSVLTSMTNKLGDCSGSQKLDLSFYFPSNRSFFYWIYIKARSLSHINVQHKKYKEKDVRILQGHPEMQCKCFSILFVVIVHG